METKSLILLKSRYITLPTKVHLVKAMVFPVVMYGCVEKAMAPHSSTLAWKIPWTEEPGGLQSPSGFWGIVGCKWEQANSLSMAGGTGGFRESISRYSR